MSESVSTVGLDLPESARLDIDTMFILLSGFMVFFMHCGFAMLSVGAVRAKNAKNILLLILLDACFGCLAFYLFGFAFAYGGTFGDEDRGNKFIGWGGFALNGVPRADWYMWFFQYAFAATAATIVSGAVAERTRFVAYIAYVIFLTSWVYPVVAHWTWSDHGWASPLRPAGDRLLGTGLVDFAGCCPVHMIGGISALAGAWVVGPRTGRYDADGKTVDMPGHNASFAILGVFILWFGWYGFNPGSALAILGSSETAALAAVNTTISAAAGTLSALVALMLLNLFGPSNQAVWDLLGAANGTLGGLVAITAGCSVVQPWAAIVIGASGGVVYVFASWLIANVLKIDDPLDAGAVHCFCGFWGLIMAAAFAHKPSVELVYGPETAEEGHGFFLGGGGNLLGAAIITALAAAAWTLGHMVPFFYVLNYFGFMRVSESYELAGIDVSMHGGHAYCESDSGGGSGKATNVLEVRQQLAELKVDFMTFKRSMQGAEGKFGREGSVRGGSNRGTRGEGSGRGSSRVLPA